MLCRLERVLFGIVWLVSLSAAVDFIPGIDVEVIPADAVDQPDLSDPQVADLVLQQWQEANDRAPASLLKPCPISCTEAGTDPEGWHVYEDAARVALCNDTMLLDFAIYTQIQDASTKTAIRACAADYASVMGSRKRQTDASSCSSVNQRAVRELVKVSSKGSTPSNSNAVSGVLAVARQLRSHFKTAEQPCANHTIKFGYDGDAVLGVYVGSQLHQQGLTDKVMEAFILHIEGSGIPETMAVQLCGAKDRGADYALGIVASATADLAFAQEAVRMWSSGKCVTSLDGDREWLEVSLQVPVPVLPSNRSDEEAVKARRRHVGHGHAALHARANCKTTKVNAGDGCWAVAQRCGISEADLTKYNTRTNFCNTLIAGETVCCSSGTLPDNTPPPNPDGTCQTKRVESQDTCTALASKCGISPADFMKFNSKTGLCASLQPGQHVCCGRGNLPDLRPKPNPDGSCHEYTTKKDDFCASIAAENGLTVEDLEKYNKQTWGWNGCKLLWSGVNMCLSEGSPPMPAPVANAMCGPTVPGTSKPTVNIDLADLNPCPLKTCCNIWGQCGTTADFCLVSKSETGAPGTAAPGSHGCISNCGMHIVKGDPPASTMRVAYFSAWNFNRDCLTMSVDMVDTSRYTHIHFAFADLTPNFKVDVSRVQEQFDIFKGIKGAKRIISFGGWDFSTSPGTYKILREAVKYENRKVFKENVVAFAPDIPGIPAGDPKEGLDYFAFLFETKRMLDPSKTVSFAAPASYWYLKAFPIEIMGAWLDYIIYMTYDLHGQWDHGNKWTSSGCPGGDCLRSHVNMTETVNALSMITKAGVPSSKVVVGVTSYGRSFRMTTAGCTGPMCTFAGTAKESPARKGTCTDTAGYISNAEINEIIAQGGNIKTYMEAGSDILVYDDYEWVAYMDDVTKLGRENAYKAFNFAGTTDWAVDLQEFRMAGEPGHEIPTDIVLGPCDAKYSSLDAIVADKDQIPGHCADQYVLSVLGDILKGALDGYDKIMKSDYDNKYNTFARAIRETWNNNLHDFYLTSTDEYYNCVMQRFDNGNWRNESVACPPKYSSGYAFSIYLIPKDESKLYRFIEEKYHIAREWIHGSVTQIAPCLPEQDCENYGKLIGPPALRPDFQIPNPKDSIQKSLGNLRELSEFVTDAAEDIKIGLFLDMTIDAVDAASVPVLMIQAAVESMKQIYEIGKDIQQKERENIILMALTAILFIIPGLGQAASAVTGLAVFARIAVVVAELGGAALGAYDIAQNPDSAPLGVFGILLGGIALRSALKPFLGEAAAVRRGMSARQIEGLGPVVKEGLDKIGTVAKLCRL
ncbi:putative glycosyl hydrolase, family 18 [Colletotrichum sp. SAR 10_70]|nr:putative glycosyl hydrolase, family 18 [Colletotrichum sp. SAR 10_71]KAI8177320.1 putative glycosyl hydrolase, family 18 [Colletotrichum sp. SAR 10_70]